MSSAGIVGIAVTLIGVAGITHMIAWAIGSYNGYRDGYDACSKVRNQIVDRFRQTDNARLATINEQSATIERLTAELQEARDMARKPLTKEQLDVCLQANGATCPRCGNDDIDCMTHGDVEMGGQTALFHAVTCDDCSEKWTVTYKAVKIDPRDS